MAVESGCATLIPPGAPIEFHFPAPANHTHVFAHFRAAEGATEPFPALQPLGAVFEEHYAALSEAAAFWAREAAGEMLGRSPRAQARLWELLWQLSRPASQCQTPQEVLVARAQAWIEARLGEPLTVSQVAREMEVSHNHLTRSFRAATGQTPVAWIRAARVARARYLLQHTTTPLKSIAAQTGLGDIHSFNKTVRRATGRGPRALRQELQGQKDTR